jgi:hypothetical protein
MNTADGRKIYLLSYPDHDWVFVHKHHIIAPYLREIYPNFALVYGEWCKVDKGTFEAFFIENEYLESTEYIDVPAAGPTTGILLA